ncbi:hypothetical protein Glove_99g104 [Diversispora epigaea]|uniref:Uncharacterized protein n=1 Tax=Diversispora epigaea TaxID=1348612 RepID=A0A397J427_9GLOM|nr:hypothetical protein Glove_99g104 [Diversispora epigaea]
MRKRREEKKKGKEERKRVERGESGENGRNACNWPAFNFHGLSLIKSKSQAVFGQIFNSRIAVRRYIRCCKDKLA